MHGKHDRKNAQYEGQGEGADDPGPLEYRKMMMSQIGHKNGVNRAGLKDDDPTDIGGGYDHEHQSSETGDGLVGIFSSEIGIGGAHADTHGNHSGCHK